jgi:DNA-binding beta-propeller fold protein YncE
VRQARRSPPRRGRPGARRAWLALVASAAAGRLGYDDCLSNDGARNCVDLPPAGPSGLLNGASGVAVSPDGKSVYVASDGPSNGSVFHFFRALGDASPPGRRRGRRCRRGQRRRADDSTALVLAGLRARAAAFLAAGAPGRGERHSACAPVGTTLEYRLSAAATVTLRFLRRLPGVGLGALSRTALRPRGALGPAPTSRARGACAA